MADAVGQQLGNYRITRLLGKGGFASVYLAEHIYLKTLAAIKILYARFNPDVLERFLIEARNLSRLTHPQIVRLLDFGIENEIPFLVMEYAPGGTLRDLHPAGSILPLPLAVSYARQAATALHYAHEHRLIHRDLKPENLLFGAHGEVLLSDFGIALAINSAEYMNVIALSGTFAYMAPEQLAGKPQAASDQYSLGIMVYEWLSGERPFQGTLTEICSQHLMKAPDPLCPKVPDLPQIVEQVVLRALAKDPQARFPDLRTFADALVWASSAGEVQATSLLTSPPKAQSEQELISYPGEQICFNNLPSLAGLFIGRDEEHKAASVLLVRPEVRLLTMVGVGGIGKTSLAISLAAGLEPTFTHGVCFVPLAPLTDHRQVIPTIALTLGLREQGQTALMESLKHFLRDKHLLLILDNLEHLMDAAATLTELLQSCPMIKLLITSRAVLHVRGEQIFIVPPLEVPALSDVLTLEDIGKSEAVRLFIERACVIRPDFLLREENARAIAEICVRLDGLPLAIELAAARIRLLSPSGLLARLGQRLSLLTSQERGIPERQRTLRDTLKWSYDLLTQTEQCLFHRLALFVDGCTLDIIEGVYKLLGEDPGPVLDGISSLLDKSLLMQREGKTGVVRLFMLETLRTFGLECLATMGEKERSELALTTYYLSYLKQLHAVRPMRAYDVPMEEIEVEYANLRTVLQMLLVRQDLKAALYLATILTGFWFLRGMISEGRNLLEQVIQASVLTEEGQEGRRRILAYAYINSAWLAYWQNDLTNARMLTESSLTVLHELGNKSSIVAARATLGVLEVERLGGDFRKGEAWMQECIASTDAMSDMGTVAHVLIMQAIHLLHRGFLAQARARFQENLDRYRSFGYNWFNAVHLHCLGWITYLEGDAIAALALFDEALICFRSLGTPLFMDEALVICASIHLNLGREDLARRLLEEVLVPGRRQENNEYLVKAFCGLGYLALYQNDLNQARISFEESVKMIDSMAYIERLQWVMAASLEGLGFVALAQNQPIWATRLFAAADERRMILGFYNPLGIERTKYESSLEQARMALGAKNFAATWEEGHNLTPAQVMLGQGPLLIPERRDIALPGDEKGLAEGLTRREIDVLRLLSQGQSNAQIAEDLILSRVTVNSYLRSIYSKLGVTSRTQAMRYAIDHDLL